MSAQPAPSSSLNAPVVQSDVNGCLALIEALGIGKCALLIADFGIADALGDTPATTAGMAARVGVHPAALGRILRYAATFGVFEEVGVGRAVRAPVMRISNGRESFR